MPGPGEYRPDPSQGITRIEDLPKPKIRCQSRNYRRRPCPRCGQSTIAGSSVLKCEAWDFSVFCRSQSFC